MFIFGFGRVIVGCVGLMLKFVVNRLLSGMVLLRGWNLYLGRIFCVGVVCRNVVNVLFVVCCFVVI